MESRRFIIARRSVGIGNLSEVNEQTGAIDPFSNAFIETIALNNVYQMGIGTETEVGLAVQRYPLRVVVGGNAEREGSTTVAIKYWAVFNAAGQSITFSRAPPVDALCIENLYKSVDGLDEMILTISEMTRNVQFTLIEDLNAMVDDLYNLTKVDANTSDNLQLIAQRVNQLNVEFAQRGAVPYFRIGENAYWAAKKHGSNMLAGAAGRTKVTQEFIASYHLNYLKLTDNYPEVNTGLAAVCAYSTAWMFRTGLYENHESKEYVTVRVNVTGDKKYTVTGIDAPEGYNVPEYAVVGTEIDCSNVKVDVKVQAVGPSLVFLSGVNHYSFNHTTAGMKVGGAMLTVLKMYNLYDSDPGHDLEEDQTRMVYESLHGSNKRGIANIWFRDSHVHCWGRPAKAPHMQWVSLDSFLKIRDRPVPAGAHKAYLAGIVLERMCKQNLVVFLPWASELDSVVTHIKTIVEQGAKSHVGAAYYTGAHSVTQGSALDPYMPELAQFVQIMSSRDTIALSPHLGPDIAARASSNWTNILKNVRNKDLSTVPADVIADYLKSTGGMLQTLDPEDRATWAQSAEDAQRSARVLAGILRL